MSRRMEATQAAQRRNQLGGGPRQSLLQRRPAAVGVGLAWVIFSVCIAWWLGAPYLKTAPENLDALEIARVSEAVQFSREAETSTPVAAKPIDSRESELDQSAAEQSQFAQWIVGHPGVVMTLGGVLIFFSLITACWALRQLWLVERERRSNGQALSERYRVAPSMVVHPDKPSEQLATPPVERKKQVITRPERKPERTRKAAANDSTLPVPRAEPPKLHLVQPRQSSKKQVAAPMQNGKRRRPDFDRIISEMSLAQNTLSRVDESAVEQVKGDSGKDAA